jgi:hypothetical protein
MLHFLRVSPEAKARLLMRKDTLSEHERYASTIPVGSTDISNPAVLAHTTTVPVPVLYAVQQMLVQEAVF